MAALSPSSCRLGLALPPKVRLTIQGRTGYAHLRIRVSAGLYPVYPHFLDRNCRSVVSTATASQNSYVLVQTIRNRQIDNRRAQSQTDTEIHRILAGRLQSTHPHRAAALSHRRRLQFCSSNKSLQAVCHNVCSFSVKNVPCGFESAQGSCAYCTVLDIHIALLLPVLHTGTRSLLVQQAIVERE